MPAMTSPAAGDGAGSPGRFPVCARRGGRSARLFPDMSVPWRPCAGRPLVSTLILFHSTTVSSERVAMLTLCIPTIDRPEFLKRLLGYYAQVGLPYQLVVGDSSRSASAQENQRTVA